MNVLDRARTNVVQSYLLSKGTICKDASGSIWKILQLWAGRQLENSLSRGSHSFGESHSAGRGYPEGCKGQWLWLCLDVTEPQRTYGKELGRGRSNLKIHLLSSLFTLLCQNAHVWGTYQQQTDFAHSSRGQESKIKKHSFGVIDGGSSLITRGQDHSHRLPVWGSLTYISSTPWDCGGK